MTSAAQRDLAPQDVTLRRQEFTFEQFLEATPHLSGPQRLALFLALPTSVREAAWRALHGRENERLRHELRSGVT